MFAVNAPGLTPTDLAAVVRACAYLRLPRRMGDYFREYLALSVVARHPDLADKVRQLSEDRLHSLYNYVRDCQALGE